jgi:hypothetical protein
MIILFILFSNNIIHAYIATYVSDTNLPITRITKVIPKDHAENHAASQHDTYAANHAHSAKDTYAITGNHVVESNATNAGIITDHAT